MNDPVKPDIDLLPLPAGGLTPLALPPVKVPSPDDIVAILQKVDQDIPKLKAFLVAAQANPLMLKLVGSFFPNLSAVVPAMLTIVPYLDFLQQLDEHALAILQP